MAQLITDFYKGTDVYSDGDVEDYIMDIVSRGVQLEELAAEEVPYPVLYHLSKERENILCWYPFREGANILEVGAGCGAITGALCRNAARVTSVDLSLRRSRINYERNRQYENLQIFVGNLNDMVFSDKFDYIVINGVFEYALSFTSGQHPYEDFLNNLLKFMKDDGRVLIAIENRLGLKYFAGAPEDHTEIYGLGLDRYRDNDSVRTFSKKELERILRACGLEYVKFYYPYPDYKFPNEIFTEETLKKNGYGKEYYNYLEDRLELFSESMVAQDLAQEGIVGCLANSFLAEAGKVRGEERKEVLYAKMNSDRAGEFQIVTTIEKEDETGSVYKRALTDKAKEHLKNMSEQEQKQQDGKYSCLAGTWDGNGIRYPFLKEDNLDIAVAEYIEAGNRENIFNTLEALFSNVCTGKKMCGSEIYSSRFSQVFGTETLDIACQCVRPANIDLICSNVFGTADGYKIIDCEWIFDFWIPEAFIIFRCLNELYCRHAGLQKLISREEMFEKFNIRQEDISVFLCWNQHFTEEYVKANQMRRYAREKKFTDLTAIVQKDKRIFASLYADYGNGFSEEEKLFLEQLMSRGRFSLMYELPKEERPIALRWDPAEGRIIKCRAFLIQGEERLPLQPLNASGSEDGWDVFELLDPQYEVPVERVTGNQVRIEGELCYCEDGEALKRMDEKRIQLQQEMEQLHYECDRVLEESHTLQKQLDNIYATRTWKIREALRKFYGRIKGVVK